MKTPKNIRESVTAVLFLLVLAVCAAFWVWGVVGPEGKYAGLRGISLETLKGIPSQAEETINTSLDRGHGFIQLYGGVQRLLGRRVLQDVEPTYTVYKLSDGSLTFVNPIPADCISANADAYLELQRVLKERGVPLLYLQAPQKIGGEGTPSLPAGVTDYGNDNADRFLSLIREGGASALDLREVLTEDGRPWTSYFFATDHHWRPETAMLCAGALADYMNEACGLKLDTALTDPSRYRAQTYEDLFLGSQGKRCGSWYAGMDDFTVWTPDFETSFTYAIQDTVREGAFEDTLLFQERLEGDPFDANPYALYSGGDYPIARITNRLNPDGPRIMLLRDSYGCAFTPFLALYCSELTTVDLRYLDGDFFSYVEQADPDYVLFLYSPSSLKDDTAFQFFSAPE